MAFGRKKQGGAAEAAPTEPKTKTRRANELLSSVVKESVISAAESVMKANDAFVLPNGTYVILGLPVGNIGGLSATQKNDEAKGSIIELIKSDDIATFETEELLQHEVLGIIPNRNTLHRVSEFNLLVGAAYQWIVVSVEENGEVVETTPVDEATFASAKSISDGTAKLSDVLDKVWAWALTDSDGEANDDEYEDGPEASDQPDLDFTEPEAEEAPAAAPVHADDEIDEDEYDDDETVGEPEFADEAPVNEPQYDEADEPVADDGPDFELGFSGEDETESGDEWDVEPDDEQGYAEAESTGDGYQDYVESNAGRTFTAEEGRGTLVRHFLSGDLDLVVDLEHFNNLFVPDSTEVRFTTSEHLNDWLGRQVGQIEAQANVELRRLRHENVEELRQLYVELMSRHIEEVARNVDTEREGSYYKKLLESAEADFAKLRDESNQIAVERRRELEATFENDVKAAGATAAAEAENRYRARHRPTVNRQIAEVGSEVEERNEEIFAATQATILQARRKVARSEMDTGETRVLEILQAEWAKRNAIETQLLEGWTKQVTDFIDENRKADQARIDALQEQQAREDTVAKVKQDKAEAIAAVTAERDAAVRTLEKRLVIEHERASAEIARIAESHRQELESALLREKAASSQAAALAGQTEQAVASANRVAQEEIVTLRARGESAAEILAAERASQSRQVKLMVGTGIVALLGALGAGVVLGTGLASQWFNPGAIDLSAAAELLGNYLP